MQLEVIKNLLKADKDGNSEILKTINRVETHLAFIKANNRAEREKRYIRKLHNEEIQRIKDPEPVEVEIEPELEDPNLTIKFSDLKRKKFEISNRSGFISQRDIIEQVF